MSLLELFISLGYTNEEYNLIRSKIELSDDSLYNYVKLNYEWFISMYDKKTIIRMTKICPFLYTLNIEYMKQKIDNIMFNDSYTLKKK